MAPLCQRMIDAMVLRGFSPRTQESYADAICGMAKHYRRDPAQYTIQESRPTCFTWSKSATCPTAP
jgi:integrase/recombinase XerD